MAIDAAILESLYQTYQPQLDLQLSKATFFSMSQAIEEQLPNYFYWLGMIDDEPLNKDFLKILHSAAIQHGASPMQQMDRPFLNLQCAALAQQFKQSKLLQLIAPPHQQGIQEQFLKRKSNTVNSLTELDIQRHIIDTDMVGHIAVVDSVSDDLSHVITHARLKQDQLLELDRPSTYHIALLVNLNPDGEAKWASVVIGIDRLSHRAHVDINTTQSLTAIEQQSLRDNIGLALDTIPNSAVTGMPLLETTPLDTIEYTFSDLALAKNGDFALLQQLYQHEGMTATVSTRDKARQFRDTAGDPEQIKSHLIAQQIAILPLTPELYEYYQQSSDPHHVLDPIVLEQLQETKVTSTHINFPALQTKHRLTTNDYQMFLLQLNKKFHDINPNHKLEKLSLNLDDEAGLQALSRLKGSLSHINIKAISLNLTKEIKLEHKAAFLFNLKYALLNLSEVNLTTLTLTDSFDCLTETEIESLTRFIETNAIAIDIQLPKSVCNSQWQRRIDEATTSAQLVQRAKNYATSAPVISAVDIAREVRSRPKLASTKVSIDVELQQEVQVEVAVESTTDQTSAIASHQDGAQLYDLVKFKTALTDNQFNPASKYYLVAADDGAEKLWRNWFGCFSQEDSYQDLQLTKAALEELMLFADKFEYGIGFIQQGSRYQHLPPGFKLSRQGDINFIDFDPQLKAIAAKDLLAVDTHVSPSATVMSYKQIHQWLALNPDHPLNDHWQSLLTSEPYDRAVVKLLQKSFLTLITMSPVQIEQLFTIGQTDGALDPAKLEFLLNDVVKAKRLLSAESEDEMAALATYVLSAFGDEEFDNVIDFINHYNITPLPLEQHPLFILAGPDLVGAIVEKLHPVHLDGLLQLWLDKGDKGLADFNTLLTQAGENLSDIQALNNHVLIHTGDYQQLLTTACQDALKSIATLPENEKRSFNTLLSQHAKANQEGHIAALFETFKHFKAEIEAITPPDQHLSLPSTCQFKNVKNMPLALSRILHLIKHVRAESRQAQLLESDKLDVSSSGFIQLLMRDFRGKQWHFVSKEMAIDPSHEVEENANPDIYRAPNNLLNHIDVIPEHFEEPFFRYVANQSANGALPLPFYQAITAKVASRRWREDCKQYFLTLIAISTTKDQK